MVATIIIATPDDQKPLEIGPRLRAELERRVRELQGRAQPTPHDLRELERLKELLEQNVDLPHGPTTLRPPKKEILQILGVQ